MFDMPPLDLDEDGLTIEKRRAIRVNALLAASRAINAVGESFQMYDEEVQRRTIEMAQHFEHYLITGEGEE